MAGKIKRLIDELMELRTASQPAQAHFIRAHLALSGIDPKMFSERSPDDPDKVRILEQMISDFRRGQEKS